MSLKVKFFLVFASFTAIVLFLPIKTLVIDVDGRVVFVSMIKNGDTVSLSHINSIYNQEVDEILKIDGNNFLLSDIITKSYGIKEYYGITENITHRKFKQIKFFNGKDRNFTLKIDTRKVEMINRYKEQELTFYVKEISLLKFLKLMLILNYEK